jgi:hypothetical protein
VYNKYLHVLLICGGNVFFLQNLELEYIYGYRGFDARSNLYYVNDGSDIIFHAAGAGIVQNLGSGKLFHIASVFLFLNVIIKKKT